jgi:outer membrane lipoprotein
MLTALLAGCASSGDVVPESLEPQVDKTVTFNQIMESPDSYRGKVVVLGGEVLKAKGLKSGAQLEVLELPLESSQRPTTKRTESRGRFLALNREFLDPATFPDGTPITIVGEVTGATTQRLDESEYRYPTLEIKHLHVWENRSYDEGETSRPWWSILGGVGFGGGGGGVGVGGVGVGTGF